MRGIDVQAPRKCSVNGGWEHGSSAWARSSRSTACPHVHVAVSRVDLETGRAVNVDQDAHAQAQPVGSSNNERDHGRRRRARTCRTARGAGGPPQPRAPMPQGRQAARAGPLDRRAAAPAAGETGPQTAASSPTGSMPDQRAQWTQLVERQRGEVRQVSG